MRTFLFILMGFVLLVGGIFWILYNEDRGAARYGLAVAQAARQQGLKAASDCQKVTSTPLPGSVKSCRVAPQGAVMRVSLTLQNGRLYEVRR